MNQPPQIIHTRCCIAGGGPAGMMLGFLLARAGVDVLVLEKHADFLRDFRGDTIHPSTLEIIHELGLLEDFLRRPHQQVKEIGVEVGANFVTVADFTRLPTHCKFLALMPQWDFLNFVVEHAKTYSTFTVRTEAQVTALLQTDDHVTGVEVSTPHGPLRVEADLVVGADGRSSTVRERASLEVIDIGAPMDVLWMRVSQHLGDPGQTLGRVDRGQILVMLDRADYFQCAYVIRKGGFDEIREKGLPAFREQLVSLAPFLRDRVEEIGDWDDIKLLTVKVDRLRQWHRPGLLCIGDAAHAMSPIGGVGINLAIQDAVAAANILAAPLREGSVSQAHLAAVQRRRELPTRITQFAQVFIQNRVISGVLAGNQPQLKLPWPLHVLRRWPGLRGIPARMVGLGFRPEHVETSGVRRASG